MRLLKTIFVAWFFAWFFAFTVHAQDIHVTPGGDSVAAFVSAPMSQYSSATGITYIFGLHPNQSINIFIVNQNAVSVNVTYQIFSTANPTVAQYTGNALQWISQPTFSSAGNSPNGNAITASITASTVLLVQTSLVNAVQVAVKFSNATNSPADIFSVYASYTTNGVLNTGEVQGVVADNASIAGINPVLICGSNTSVTTCVIPEVGANGGWVLAIPQTTFSAALVSQEITAEGTNDNETRTIPTAGSMIYSTQGSINNSKVGTWTPYLSVDNFWDTSATASGSTLIHTASAGKVFSIICVGLDVTGDSTQAVAGDLTVQLYDGATALPGFKWQIYVPAVALNVGELYTMPQTCFWNGYHAAEVTGSINVNLSSALTAGHVEIRVWGDEQ